MSAQVPRIGHDRDGMLAAMRYMRQAFSDGRAASVNRVAEDDKVVVQDVVRGTHQGEFMGVPATERRVSFEFAHSSRVRTRCQSCGLSPPTPGGGTGESSRCPEMQKTLPEQGFRVYSGAGFEPATFGL